MGAAMSFEGRLCFATTADRDAWLDRVTSANDCMLDIATFERGAHYIAVDSDTYGPSSMWHATLTALYEAAHLAWEGFIRATYESDETCDIVAGKRRRATPSTTSVRVEGPGDELLVFYALADEDAEPVAGTPSYVLPVDALETLVSDRAPYISVTTVDDLVEMLDRAPAAGARLIEWMIATAMPIYGYQIEPKEIAGAGTARARGLEEESRPLDDDDDGAPVARALTIDPETLQCLACGGKKVEKRSDDFGVEAKCLDCGNYEHWTPSPFGE